MSFPKRLTTLPKQTGETVPLRVGGYIKLGAIEKTLEKARAELVMARRGAPVCVERCGKCCRAQLILATRAEAEYAFARMHELGPNAMKRIREICINWIISDNDCLKVRGTSTIRNFTPEQQQQVMADAQYVQGQTGCPFINEQDECIVHAVRPIPCQAFSVTNMPEPYCRRPMVMGETEQMRMFVAGEVEFTIARQFLDFREFMTKNHPEGLTVGFWPTILLSVLDPEALRKLSESPDVPTAKIAVFANAPIPWRLYRANIGRMAVPAQTPVAT